jgi:hypothetical protein
MANLTQIVQEIYANFGRGDIPAIIETLAALGNPHAAGHGSTLFH